MIYKIIMVILRIFVPVLYRVRVTGRENIPNGAAVVCGNHTAQHDPVFVMYAFGGKHRLYPMSKKENETMPIMGRLLKAIDCVFVDRGKNDLGAIKKSMKMLKEGRKLLVFPEGTRVAEGETIAAKRGAVMLASRNDAHIVPVFITAGKKPLFSRINVIIGTPYKIVSEGKPGGKFMDEKAAEIMRHVAVLGGAA